MTRVAILADIHGNTAALEAVVADVARQAPDLVLVGGDLVGRGPEGSAVVARIRELGWPSIRGNHEDYLLDFRHRRVPEEWWHQREWAAARWMAAELSDADAGYIESLPYTLTAPQAPGLLLAHGTPRSANEGLGPWTSDRALGRQLDAIEESVLVVAHTHRPMRRRLADGEVVNVGSVGLPFNGDPRAQYAILTLSDGGCKTEFRQVDYDRERTRAAFRETGFLDAGGVTAELLAMELDRARPFLVPFITWARTMRLTPESRRVAEFLDLYDPEEPMWEFFARLKAG